MIPWKKLDTPEPMSLDKRLKEILHELEMEAYEEGRSGCGDENAAEKAREAIKQAFIDEGWVQVPKEVQETWREYNRMAGYMTGPEWLARFKEEHDAIAQVDAQGNEPRDAVLEAARRAAGVDE